MNLIARKTINSLDKEIIVESGGEYWIFKTEQVVNTSELKWLRLTRSQVDLLIKKYAFKSYEHEEKSK